jgi:ABC-2 type transport system ATP-binding protein
MITVENLTKIYPDNTLALDDISFTVERGEICGYIGPNGAGKSTTMKIIAGMLKPDKGSVFVSGIDVTRDADAAKQITGYVPESGALYLSLTPYDFLEFVCRMYGMTENDYKKKIYGYLDFFDLKKEVSTPMQAFSKGMRQKVLIISSLIHDPEIILWDEPFSGIDYTTILSLRDLVRELSAKGCTFLYSTHVIETIDKLCTKIIVLNSGRIVLNEAVGRELDTEKIVTEFFIDKSPCSNPVVDNIRKYRS